MEGMAVVIEFGQHKGKDIQDTPLPWLLFMVTRFNIRRAYPVFIEQALVELARRVAADHKAATQEMLITEPPPSPRPKPDADPEAVTERLRKLGFLHAQRPAI